MGLLSNYNKYYRISDANVVAADIAEGKIAYGPNGRLLGTLGAVPFDQVSLLLHMNGVDASTTFTDNSDNAHVVTANGDAQIDTADFKFGTAAGLFDGTGDYLSIPYVAGDFDWWDNDYTIECWVKAAAWTDWQNVAGQSALIGRMDVTGSSVYWSFGPMNDGTLKFYYWTGTGRSVATTTTIPTGVWTHIAMTYSNVTGLIKLFIGGILENTTAIILTPLSLTYPLIIGQANSKSITGSIDDLRIIKGAAIYANDFTPPTQQFSDS